MTGQPSAQSPSTPAPQSSNAPAAAAPAPGTTQQPSAAAQGALTPEVTEYLKTQGSELRAAQGLIASLRAQQEQTQGTLGKIKEVFAPSNAPAPDPIADKIASHEAKIDEALATAIQAERAGRPIPETIKAQIEAHQIAIDNLTERRENRTKVGELEQRVQQLSDPGNIIDQMAFSQMDNFIMNAMQTVYGNAPEYAVQRQSNFKSVASQMLDEVRRLKKEQPEIWDQIRRQPEKQRSMVNWFVEQNMPPKARLIMEQERLKNEPMSLDDYEQAHREAATIPDPVERAKIRTRIRQEMWAEKFTQNRRRPGAMNRVMRG